MLLISNFITNKKPKFTAELHLSLLRVSQRNNYCSKECRVVRVWPMILKETDSRERKIKVIIAGFNRA